LSEVYLQYHRLVESFRSRKPLDSDLVLPDARIRAAFMRVLEEEIEELRDDQIATTDILSPDTLTQKKVGLSQLSS